MKRKWTVIFDIPRYMAAGVGLISSLNLILKGYTEVPALLVMSGLGLGLLMWWKETKEINGMDFGGNIKALKFYIYLFYLFVYVLALFGLIEIFSLIFDRPSIEVYKSLTFSWKWGIVLLVYFVAWNSSAERFIGDIMKNMNIQKS